MNSTVPEVPTSTHELFIGAWTPAAGGRTYERESPSQASTLVGRFAEADPIADVDRAVEAGLDAQVAWARRTPAERGAVLLKAAALLRDRVSDVAHAIAWEEGKTLADAAGEVDRSAAALEYFATYAWAPSGVSLVSARADVTVQTRRDALGVVSLITPFNFPVFVASFKLGPALMGGNAVLWKPSPLTPLAGVHLMNILNDAGVPAGLVSYLTGSSNELGERLVSHRDVAAVSFTGSTQVGRHVAVTAASHGKRAQVEMGGHNPAIVLADADLDHAVACIVDGAFYGTGQKCTATARVLVEESIADDLTDRLVQRVREITVGPSLDPASKVGPVVSRQARDGIAAAVERAVAEGATLAAGGVVPTGPSFDDGYYYPPTLLTNVTPTMTIAKEEVFGPVCSVVRVSDIDEAVAVANGTAYGLSASIFTRDYLAIQRFAQDVRAGSMNVNLPTTGIEPHVPFGGLKDSGYGPAELGASAIDFFTEQSTVAVWHGSPA